MKSSDIHIRAISLEMPQPSITKICLKSTYLKFHSNFPGTNELKALNSLGPNQFGFTYLIVLRPGYSGRFKVNTMANVVLAPCVAWGGWGCEVSCGGHHRPREKTTTGSALDGAVFDIAQILAYLVHNMSSSQLCLGFGHFGWFFFRSITFWQAYG